ncbi:MAG: right-handed parallel beta-helix repeat-containing protein [Deltaproteobacteria bacterium]|nr:right-handed parallel beta-helix repeat-containing protein [Deltaproteobacteria bacterium]
MHRALPVVLLVACGGDSAPLSPDAGGDPAGDGAVGSCEPPGRFGAPASTFTLPATAGRGIAYADVQAAFPEVDWSTLDRLYIPAGSYTNLMLGNLPVRTADRPLVITNKGGQVVIGRNHGQGNYIWSMGGGANWILTGRADDVSQTGDAAFPGHACGGYPDATGRYGLLSDDEFALSAPYLHMGIAVGGGATDFEIEFVEVTRSGFAGIRLYNDHTLDQPMANVRVHDTYVHDTDGEGFYFGWTGAPPSNKFPGLQIYNNRILRTGNEALQIQDVGDGSRIHHNTFISGGLHWLDNGLGRYQDSNSQILVREGTIEFDHNIFIDGAGTLVSFFSSPQPGDGDRHVTFHDNYFSDAIDLGMYLNGTSTAGSSFTWSRNVFRNFDFAYTPADPQATDPDVIAGRNGAFQAPVTFEGNRWIGTSRIVAGIAGGDGTAGNVTLTGNRNEDAGAIELRDGPWSSAGHHLTSWAPNATVAPGSPPVTYRAGDVVVHGAAWTLYRATDATANPPPGPAWTPLAAPTDDVRVAPGTAYAGLGVQ